MRLYHVRSRIALITVLAFACACGGVDRKSLVRTSRESAITAHTALNALAASFAAWSTQHQEEIYAAGKAAGLSDEEIKAQIAAFRQRRDHVTRAFGVAYSAIIAVAAALPLVEIDKLSLGDLVTKLQAVATAVADVQKALEALQGDGP